MRLAPAYIAPVILLLVAVGLLIGGVAPAWWIVLLVAVGVYAILLLSDVGARRTSPPTKSL